MFPPASSRASSVCFLFNWEDRGFGRGVCNKKEAGIISEEPPKETGVVSIGTTLGPQSSWQDRTSITGMIGCAV